METIWSMALSMSTDSSGDGDIRLWSWTLQVKSNSSDAATIK